MPNTYYIMLWSHCTLRMIGDCIKNGFRAPVWTDNKNVTTVMFPALTAVIKNNEGVNEGVGEGVNTLYFWDENEGVNRDINTLYQAIVQTPGLKTPALSERINKGISTTERYIKKLKEAGYIAFVGAPKNGGYFVKEPIYAG